MSTDQQLMGLGLPPALAVRMANSGSGPVLQTAGTGTQTATTPIGGKQFMVFVNAPGTGGSLRLPAVGGSDMAAEITDDFIIHNGVNANLTIYAPLNATVNVGGTQYSGNTGLVVAAFKTLTYYPISQTLGFGLTA